MATLVSFSEVSAEITEVVKNFRLSEELKEFIKKNADIWPNFGKKNSHLYRDLLMKMMLEAGMSMEAKVMVYFFMAVIKNVDRVKKAMDNMSEEVKGKAWFSQVRDFYGTKITQYVTQADRQKKFPAVNIPATNPGLDIMFHCLMLKKEDRTLENLKFRVTFCQLALNDELQGMAKEGYRKFWDETVRGSNNPDAITMNLPQPRMREEYYINPASDKYPLLDKNLKVVVPTSNESGYTRQELLAYLSSFD
jgi:hypothetical protein